MKALFFILLFIPTISFGQSKLFKFFSDYQFDKTYDGSKKAANHKVTITFSDPKLIPKPRASMQRRAVIWRTRAPLQGSQLAI
jgi:hypothetical protein